MSRFLHEPLLHFLLLGAGLFLVHAWIGGRPAGGGEAIVITRGRIDQLAAGFTRMHQRVPDSSELDALIDDAIREEVFYREAKALGLDQDDTIVRRRLRQKLEFVSEDIEPVQEPGDMQLQAYLQAHPERFRSETRYSLTQAYFNPQRRGPRLADDIGNALQVLPSMGAAGVRKVSDPLSVQHRFDNASASELVRVFGAGFEAALRSLPTNAWHGPVESGYGVHLVRIDVREDSRTVALEDVRDEVRGAWIHDQRKQANERFYAGLRKRHDVTVERPAAPGEPTSLVAGIGQ